MTRQVAVAGVPFQNWIRMDIEATNHQGALGSVKIKLTEADKVSNKVQVINLANQANDHARAIMVLGPSNSSDGVAVAPIFNETVDGSPVTWMEHVTDHQFANEPQRP